MFQAASGQILASVLGIPFFLLYLVVAVALLVLFVMAYVRITPHDEIALIREGNVAAAIAMGGTMIGFVIPLARAVQQASSMPDMLVWGIAAFVVQLCVFAVVSRILPDLSARIKESNMAAGVLLGTASIATGMLNAAAMTS